MDIYRINNPIIKMKLIPSYQEFVYDLPLNGKISTELAESLSSDFEEIESLNEGFMDSLKNTLSKTFLGSLSYINMIDKAREMMMKDQKDLLSKEYAHADEIDSLKTQLKQLQVSGDSVNSDKIKKTISNKQNEYKTYVNMLKKRIEKTEETLSKMVGDNKRRSEYYDAGKSQDDLDIAEFEYKIAKARTKSDPKEVKELENKVKTAKEEALLAQEELKLSSEKYSKGENSPKGKPRNWEKIKVIEDKMEELKLEIRDLKRKKEDKGGKLEYSDILTLKGKQDALARAKKDLEKIMNKDKSKKSQASPEDQKNTNSETGTLFKVDKSPKVAAEKSKPKK
jgi:hypothetical protein